MYLLLGGGEVSMAITGQVRPDAATPCWPARTTSGAAPADSTAVLTATAEMLRFLVPCDLVTFTGLDARTGRAVVHGDPPDEQRDRGVALLLPELPDHPMAHRFTSGRVAPDPSPVRMSDLLGLRELRRTRTWAELFRPRGVTRQLVVPTGGDLCSTAQGWSLNRSGGDFSVRDLAVLTLLQPVLAALDRAHGWGALPGPGGRPHDLTGRELEVLALLAEDLTAAAIGRRLEISSSTVRKHVENIYAKIGHRGRLPAVGYARDQGLLPASRQPVTGAATRSRRQRLPERG